MRLFVQASAIALLAMSTTAAVADRKHKHEPASVKAVLHANGFVSWDEIEWDDGRWEVDDARHRNGHVYDLDIRNGRIIRRERER